MDTTTGSRAATKRERGAVTDARLAKVQRALSPTCPERREHNRVLETIGGLFKESPPSEVTILRLTLISGGNSVFAVVVGPDSGSHPAHAVRYGPVSERTTLVIGTGKRSPQNVVLNNGDSLLLLTKHQLSLLNQAGSPHDEQGWWCSYVAFDGEAHVPSLFVEKGTKGAMIPVVTSDSVDVTSDSVDVLPKWVPGALRLTLNPRGGAGGMVPVRDLERCTELLQQERLDFYEKLRRNALAVLASAPSQ